MRHAESSQNPGFSDLQCTQVGLAEVNAGHKLEKVRKSEDVGEVCLRRLHTSSNETEETTTEHGG